MKRTAFALTAAFLLIPLLMSGQTFQTLWKQVEEAQNKDLPKTAMSHLKKIEQKADKEKAYGQLLKATLLYSKLQSEVAPDSLSPAVRRLEKREQATHDAALKAVYDVVLSKIYSDNRELAEDWEKRSSEYRQLAKENPEQLAAIKADSYLPFVIKEKDSECFQHDLLSIVGMELQEWQWLSTYYSKVGNRQAACLTALHTANTTQSIDSLINIYGDLQEAGELAIKRYELMNDNRNSSSPRFSLKEKNDWLLQSIQRWGKWKRANELHNALTLLNNPQYQVHIPQYVVEVNKPQYIQCLQLRNLQSLTMRIYRTNLTGDTDLSPDNNKQYQQIKSGMTELKDLQRTLTFTSTVASAEHASYDIFEDSLQVAGLPSGVYLLEFSSAPDTRTTRMLYFVSGIRVISQALPDNKMRYIIVDATSGQPIAGAQLRLSFSKGYNKPAETLVLTCDKQGEAVYTYSKQRPSSVFAYTNSDNSCPDVSSYGNYNYYERQYNTQHTNLFTDRSIYRPGQRVHVAAIVWKDLSATDNIAVSGEQLKLELRDANYKIIAEQQLTTDRFGKCQTEFTLPKGLLNGRFTITTSGASTSIQVEEYKRPTFQVEFAEYNKAYQNGDTITVSGKASTYAGVPVQNAKVKYTVKRRVAFWWMSYSRYWQYGYTGHSLQEEVLSEGETLTEEDGTFCIDMPMELPADISKHPMFYHFVVEAEVTDVAGETHRGNLSLPLGNKATVLTCNLPSQIRSDQLPALTFNRRNAAGKDIAGSVRYRIDEKKWKQAEAGSPLSLKDHQLKSGKHRLEAVCDNDSLELSFVVFGLNDKKPATQTKDWWYVSDSQFPADGKPVTIQVGSSDADMHIVYNIFAGTKMLESGAVEKNAALENRKFTYKEEYGNGLLVSYAWVKDGECHQHQTFIRRPMPDKQLKLTWETFRDRLTPGQEEEWRLAVKKPDGTAADASILAVLYDKSLDAIKSHQWNFSPANTLAQPSTSWRWRSWGSKGMSAYQNYQLLNVPTTVYSYFDQSVFPVYIRPLIVGYGGRLRGAMPVMMAKTAAIDTADSSSNEVFEQKANSIIIRGKNVQGNDAAEMTADTQNEEPAAQEVQVRENLNETAFCYPTLETNSEGIATLKFTLPESLTSWRFMGIANTTDMLYGYIDGEAVAQKDVMIQPNMPRFIRMGDEGTIAARIFNNTDHSIAGTARMQLIDPETEQVVFEQQQPFSVEAGKTGSATFALQHTSFSTSLLVCKVMAVGDGFSDGEQHYMPILPDREMVTKTVPYTQHQPGVKRIDLQQLFPQGTTQQKLTVEYTNNPVWLMVQALSVIGTPCEHSAIDQAAAYYSNLLAKTLVAQSPQVKRVFEQWKHEESTAAGQETLQSQLEKNEELKDLVLSETPWLNDANRENEQKHRLADFFDDNTIAYRLSAAVEKLKKLQNSDGSFSWYPGMDGSTYMTVAVEEMLARLSVMAGQQTDIRELQDKAFNYIGKEMVDLVAKMKQAEKKGHKQTFPSFTALRWLYICAIDGRKLPSNVKSANGYLINLLKKDIKRQTIYEKALTAIVLTKNGEHAKASEYVKSLKEYTVYTEEMGRYYDTRRATYSWYDYKIPTEVAAIEAILQVTPSDVQTVDEMRRWLLQEKRTQSWDTPINSVNAIWAFLYGNSQALTTGGNASVLAIDGKALDVPQATAGLGYVKTAVHDLTAAHTFTATKTSEGTSWGAVYAQFLQKTAEVEASKSGISIKREVIQRTADGKPLIVSEKAAALKVGDRVTIRLTIDSERDLDFVQVVDRRAACFVPINQLSGYRNGAYTSPKDYATQYFLSRLAKGRLVLETEYYIDRKGQYETGTCTIGCAYAPEYRATAPSMTIKVNE